MPKRISDEEFSMLPSNKQKEIMYDRERHERNKQKRKEQRMEYREKNKDKINQHAKDYYEKNKDKRQEYIEKNKERIKESYKTYSQSDDGIKSKKISNWKAAGFKHTSKQFDVIYERYCNTSACETCNAPMILRCNNIHTKCADHDHSSGCFRNVVCRKCNAARATQDMKRMNVIAELHRVFIRNQN